MKIILTKYVTTTGPLIREASIRDDGIAVITDPDHQHFYDTFIHNEWHSNSKEALEDIKRQFSSKRARLKKELAALNKKEHSALTAVSASGI